MSVFMVGDQADVIKRQNAADAAGVAGTGRTMSHLTGISSGWSPAGGMSVITFPQGLGDDPAQPFFMTYVPKQITSAVGGTMGDMSFRSVTATK